MQYFFDENDRGYLDGFGFIATASCSHCHPEVVKAIANQINNLITELLILPEALASKLPGNLKGIGNGIPLGVMVTTPEIAEVLTGRLYNNTLEETLYGSIDWKRRIPWKCFQNHASTMLHKGRRIKNNASTIDHDTTRNKEILIDMINKGNPTEIVSKNVIKAIKALQKSTAATVLVGLLMMCGPYSALAATGERYKMLKIEFEIKCQIINSLYQVDKDSRSQEGPELQFAKTVVLNLLPSPSSSNGGGIRGNGGENDHLNCNRTRSISA
ncbi:Uncharacterized protein Fot_34244 [Forsythia ovata]|uniref:Uncharacterized protein n=1 Tax=Forsythia ovata TaxID=205694 RepID=A0ABD1SIA2_9LAMI